MLNGYKMLRQKNGKLYPMYVNTGVETPVGIWLEAKEGERMTLDELAKAIDEAEYEIDPYDEIDDRDSSTAWVKQMLIENPGRINMLINDLILQGSDTARELKEEMSKMKHKYLIMPERCPFTEIDVYATSCKGAFMGISSDYAPGTKIAVMDCATRETHLYANMIDKFGNFIKVYEFEV
jgi:hypothetical protein